MRRGVGAVVAGAMTVLLLVPVRLLAKDAELPGGWRRADVIVDGSAGEWIGKLMPLGALPVVVGVLNDASFLYLCLRTSDESVKKQILGVGLSFFFDASAREDRAFGLRYPIGRLGPNRVEVPDTGDEKVTRALDLSVAGARLRILGRGETDMPTIQVSDVRPLEAALGEEEGALVVELKIPLVFSVESPHALGTQPGKTIALGIETAEPRVKRPRGEGGGSGGSGGFSMRGGGRGGGSRGGGGMGRGGRGESEPRGERDAVRSYGKPLKVWVTVPLAAPPKD